MGFFDFLFRKKDNSSGSANSAGKGNQHPLLEKVEVKPGLKVSRALANHWDKIEATALSFIAIKATPAVDLPLSQSKFGHFPLIPADFPYPVDSHGRYMFPLAQLNFAEIPRLEGYPSSGWLQFYISEDNMHGMDDRNPQSQKDFRVLYFEETELHNHRTDFSFLGQVMASDTTPVYKSHSLSFSEETDYIGVGDVRYEEKSSWKIENIIDRYSRESGRLEKEIWDLIAPGGHKIGGYANFTQWDPRIGNLILDQYILLFQMDSDDEIMWGDTGIANFFILPEDLAKKDFSKVMYTWDCT